MAILLFMPCLLAFVILTNMVNLSVETVSRIVHLLFGYFTSVLSYSVFGKFVSSSALCCI